MNDLAERPLARLIQRHAELTTLVMNGNTAPLFRMEIESIENELIDRDKRGGLDRINRDQNGKTWYDRAQAIIQRGSSLRQTQTQIDQENCGS